MKTSDKDRNKNNPDQNPSTPDLTPTSEINKKNTERPYDSGDSSQDDEERQNTKDELFDRPEEPKRSTDPSGEFDVDYENIFML